MSNMFYKTHDIIETSQRSYMKDTAGRRGMDDMSCHMLFLVMLHVCHVTSRVTPHNVM
jgi:hypothetical protein